jgi:hypothetical protein
MKADPTDGYDPDKKDHEGYYVGTNQDPAHKAEDATDNNPKSVPAADRDGEDGEEGEKSEGGDGKVPLPEKIAILQPLSYLRRADNNFFGGRTTFYTQLDSEIKGADEDDDVTEGQTGADNVAAPEGGETAGNDSDIEPEKISLLDPEAYELRSIMNTPNMRTTWYGSTKGVEETADLLQMRKKHRKHRKHRETPAAGAAPAGDKPQATVAPPEKV